MHVKEQSTNDYRLETNFKTVQHIIAVYIESQDLAHFLWPWLYYHVKTNLQVQWKWEVRWFSLIMISYECFNTLITSYMSQVIVFFISSPFTIGWHCVGDWHHAIEYAIETEPHLMYILSIQLNFLRDCQNIN